MAKKPKTDERRTRVRVTDLEFRLMLRYALRNERLFARLRQHLPPEKFRLAHQEFGMLWRHALAFHKRHSELPTKEVMQAGLAQALEGDPDILGTGEEGRQKRDRLRKWIAGTYDDPAIAERADSAAGLAFFAQVARNYLEEEFVVDLGTALQPSLKDGALLEDVPGLLESASQRVRVLESIAAVEPPRLFVPGWDLQCSARLRSTGIPFLDHFLGGGHAPGEIYGLLGPFGSCKTTLSIMLWAEAARLAAAADRPGEKGLSFFFSYETDHATLRNRALSYVAQIDKDVLANLGERGGLQALADVPQPYEADFFSGETGVRRRHGSTERQRVLADLEWMNDRMICFAFNDPHVRQLRGRGNGYVPEIVSLIENTLASVPGSYCALVVIDYLGLCAKKHRTAMNLDPSAQTTLLGDMPMLLRDLVARPFGCPVWGPHQYRGQANRRGASARMSNADAAGCSSLAENEDYSLELGPMTGENVLKLSCSKHRRSAPVKTLVLQVLGQYGTVRDVSSSYSVDEYGSIGPTSAVRQVGALGASGFVPVGDDDE